jgi:glutamine cyclotransferase
MSDGTAKLYFMDPATFRVRRTVVVHDEKGEIRHLNELENVGGRIYANVWKTYRIAIIRPEDGRLTAWIDLVDIMNRMEDSGKKDVMNGIAWDAERNRLFVTGKWWPKLFEIRVR